MKEGTGTGSICRVPYLKTYLSRDTILLNACLHAPDGDGSAENGEGGEQDGGDGECAPQRELAALQRFRTHMVQAVHGHQGLGNAGEKKVTNVVVIRNARARHSVNWPRSSGSGRTWFRLYTDTTAWEMREKRRLQMSSLFCSRCTWFRLYTDTTA